MKRINCKHRLGKRMREFHSPLLFSSTTLLSKTLSSRILNDASKPVAKHFKAGFHMIADDRGSQTIADRRSQIAQSSAIVCDHMETHFCDRLRSCDRDRRRSQTIAEDRTMFYLLRSSAIVCDPAIIWKPKFCDLRSKCIP